MFFQIPNIFLGLGKACAYTVSNGENDPASRGHPCPLAVVRKKPTMLSKHNFQKIKSMTHTNVWSTHDRA